ncbi:MAG: ABC transporter permease [Ardenticatenaceae bacterium]
MAVAELQAEALAAPVEESQLLIIWNRFRRHRLALAGGIVISFLLLMVIFAPALSPYEYTEQARGSQHLPPFSTDRQGGYHILGTDELGRDLFTRLWYAGRISLVVGISVAFIETIIGIFVGAVSGYYGGWIDSIAMRLVDLIISLPLLPVLLVLSTLLRGFQIPGIPREWASVAIIVFVLAGLRWTSSARLLRGMVLSLRNQEFAEASKALGVSDTNIILRHMIPNSLAPLIVSATLAVGSAILIESALSFLGFGVQPPVPTWGNMLSNAQTDMFLNPFKALYPGILIFLTVLSFNFLGDGLRDALDPRLKM